MIQEGIMPCNLCGRIHNVYQFSRSMNASYIYDIVFIFVNAVLYKTTHHENNARHKSPAPCKNLPTHKS